MKRTLLAVTLPALLAGSVVSASTVYDNNDTKLDVYGQLRLGIDYSDTKKDNNRDDIHVSDMGSRFGILVQHALGRGLHAIGGFEFGNNSQRRERVSFEEVASSKKISSFEVQNRLGFVGFKLDRVGEVTIGRVLSPFDDVALSDYSYSYGGILDFGHVASNDALDNFIGRVSNTVRYMSDEWNGFSFGATYTLEQDDAAWGQVGAIDNAFTLAGFYNSGIGLKINAGFGYAKLQDAEVLSGAAIYQYADSKQYIWGVAAEYVYKQFSIAVDIGQNQEKFALISGSTTDKSKRKTTLYGLGLKYALDKKTNVYGGAYYGDGNKDTGDATKQVYVVGTDYRFTPSVRTFVEYGYVEKEWGTGTSKRSDDSNNVVLGMRLYF